MERSQKTLREWFNELPLLERKSAIENTIAEVGEGVLDTLQAWTLRDAISGAFTWDKTPQGHCYWESIYNQKSKAA